MKAFLRRTDSFKRSALAGLKDTFQSDRPTSANDVSYLANDYIQSSFYDDENYEAFIKCVNGGYEVCKDVADYMEDYSAVLEDYIDSLRSCSKSWKSKLKQQLSLSSYHTTKRAQSQTMRITDKEAELVQARLNDVKEVINEYRQQLDRLYPKERSGIAHKHRQSDYMKNSFKAAHTALSDLYDSREKLRADEKKAKASLHQANVECENLSLNPVANESKVASANEKQVRKQRKMDDIKKQIEQCEQAIEKEKKSYRQKAFNVYNECREFERERLDLIGKTLIKFVEAAHPADHVAEQQTLYTELLSNLKLKRDTSEDLDFWAHTYGVYSATTPTPETPDQDVPNALATTRKTKKSHKNETNSSITADENT